MATEIYKGWQISKNEFNYYVAHDLNDCDAFEKFSRDLRELKEEIDEDQ